MLETEKEDSYSSMVCPLSMYIECYDVSFTVFGTGVIKMYETSFLYSRSLQVSWWEKDKTSCMVKIARKLCAFVAHRKKGQIWPQQVTESFAEEVTYY